MNDALDDTEIGPAVCLHLLGGPAHMRVVRAAKQMVTLMIAAGVDENGAHQSHCYEQHLFWTPDNRMGYLIWCWHGLTQEERDALATEYLI